MSFDIALSGIQAINQQLDATSNNIANAGTYGFKSSRTNFASLYAGDQPNGVEVGSMTQNIGAQGGVQSTGRDMDAMIQGRGFFVSRDAQGVMNYTRVGIFDVDKNGYLVDASKRRVQGYGSANGGAALGVMGDIVVPTGQIPAVATTKITYVGNMSADWPVPVAPFDSADPTSYNMVKQSILYDSLGTKHTVDQYYVKSAAANTVNVYYSFDGAAITTALPPPAVPAVPIPLTFNANGQLTMAPPTVALILPAGGGAAAVPFKIDYTGTTQFAGDAVTSTNRPDGYASGVFVGAKLGEDGSVIAKYSNEEQQVVGTIALATFPDEGQLAQISDTSWTASQASGNPLYDRPGVGLAGKLGITKLEGSNVDVTSELVGLMTSQRNYQANSKVITTENAMMQSLMQAM
jgi:flagellar hook protein FlgE